MKPPWKYLAQLVSRQRPVDKTDQTREGDNDRKPVEIELQPLSELSSVSPAAAFDGEQGRKSQSPDPIAVTEPNATEVEQLEAVSPLVEAEAQSVEAIDEHEQVVTDVAGLAPASEPAEPSTMPRKTPSKPARKARINRTTTHPAVADKEPVTQSPSVSANPLFDEAANLDDDIKQLKEQLAQKLRLQNAQFRKMLERFDRS